MKRLLALDIGITTGYAVWAHVSEEWTLFTYGEIYEDDYQDSLGDVLFQYMVDHTVAERPVIIRGPLGDRLARLVVATETLVSPLKMVDPSAWKSSPSKRHPCPRGTSAHTKDAIRLGHWHLGRL